MDKGFMSHWLDWFNEWLFNDSPPLPKCLFCNRSIELTNPTFFCNEVCEEQYHNKLTNHKCLYKDEVVVLKGQGCLCYECTIKSCPFNKQKNVADISPKEELKHTEDSLK